eukprot:scaffold159496_cov39-Attheya_sp.AAC.1
MATGCSSRADRPVTAPDPEVEHSPPFEPMWVEGRCEGFKRDREEKGCLQAGEANNGELGKVCSKGRYAGIQDAARKRRPAVQGHWQGAEGVVDLDARWTNSSGQRGRKKGEIGEKVTSWTELTGSGGIIVDRRRVCRKVKDPVD